MGLGVNLLEANFFGIIFSSNVIKHETIYTSITHKISFLRERLARARETRERATAETLTLNSFDTSIFYIYIYILLRNIIYRLIPIKECNNFATRVYQKYVCLFKDRF